MAKASNLIGNRYGKLVVVERAENNKKGNTMWKCQCDCGKTKIALGYDLTHGRTVSCGCNNVGKVSPQREDITGQRFGTLTAVSVNNEMSCGNSIKWNCVCDCGAKVVVSHSNLKSGHTMSHRGCALKERPYNFEYLSGMRFGRLTVVRESGRINGKVAWLCKCDCGNEKVVTGNALRCGDTRSCGCLFNESRRKPKHIKHGMCKSRIYKKYVAMLSRCSPTYHGAKSYYERGVCVCDEWKGEDGFINFRDWSVANGFDESVEAKYMTLDRIDVDGIYSPDNCRWTTMKVQQNNKTDNVYVEYLGERKTLKQWSEYLGLSYGMLKGRRRRGITVPKLFEPSKNR